MELNRIPTTMILRKNIKHQHIYILIIELVLNQKTSLKAILMIQVCQSWGCVINHIQKSFLYFFTNFRGNRITNIHRSFSNAFYQLYQSCTKCCISFVFYYCAELHISFSTTLIFNRGFGFDRHIHVLETCEMKMFILSLYHNNLCKLFI